MNWKSIGIIAVALTVATQRLTAQDLPVEIQADLLLTKVKASIDKNDWAGAVESLKKLKALDVELPDEFHYNYGRALSKAGDHAEGLKEILTYLLKSGGTGKYEKEAMEVFVEIKNSKLQPGPVAFPKGMSLKRQSRLLLESIKNAEAATHYEHAVTDYAQLVKLDAKTPEDFLFLHGRALYHAHDGEAARVQLAAYMKQSGQSGAHYKEALNLYVKCEKRLRSAPENASMERPFENSLGMKFVPVPGADVLFSIWETRVRDFEAFSAATGHDATEGVYSLGAQTGHTWENPGFQQSPDHAVCGVSWEDAQSFCKWLTDSERKAGRIPVGARYRLPRDEEWSKAVGLQQESGSTPRARNMKIKNVYPWGPNFPPPVRSGNYAGSEASNADWPDFYKTIDGYRDLDARVAAVGSYAANEFGVYDLGGNVWEWCEDWIDPATRKHRVKRGGCWSHHVSPSYTLLSSFRRGGQPSARATSTGFRAVLDSVPSH